MVCDAKGRIRDVARWKGSTHDSRIWNECTLKRKFEVVLCFHKKESIKYNTII